MNNSIPIRVRRMSKVVLNKCISAFRRENKQYQKDNVAKSITYDVLHWGLCLISFAGIVGIVLISIVLTASAQCQQATAAMKRSGMASAEKLFESCALSENDEVSQITLARYYQNKVERTTQDKLKSLFYYHLAAENGNADAQVALARLLMKMDETEEDRSVLLAYIEQMSNMMEHKGAHFKGELMHPYALLMLAAEGEEQKWYYSTTQKKNTQARELLKQYQITPEKKTIALRQAAKWKQQKMKETAEEVLSYIEYRQFMDTVYPEKGSADAFERQQAIEQLKEKVKKYLQ